MALPANRSLRQVQVDCFSPSVGASPVAAVARAPSRGTIVKVGGVLIAGLSTSDCSVAVKINGTAMTGSPFTMTQAGSAEGSVFTMIPTGANNVNEDDAIEFEASGSAGASVGCTFFAVIDRNDL